MSRPSHKLLKVLFVTESYPPKSYGGGEISCALLAEALAEREDIEVTVLTSEVEGLNPREIKNGVKIIRSLRTGSDRSSLKENLKRRMYFKKSVKNEINRISHGFDIIHFFNITSMINVNKPSFATINSYLNFCPKGNLFYKDREVCTGCSFSKFIGCITKSEYVGGYRLKSLLKYNLFFWIALYWDYKKRKKCLKYVDHFFSLSTFINQLLSNENVDLDRVTKLVNIPSITKSTRNIDLDKDRPVVAYIGDLSKIKGVDMLIKAFNRVNAGAKLIIVGHGPEREKLENLADSTIEFLGRVDHDLMHSVYRQADVIVVPSLWPEPLSRVLLESACFGKPVIATKVGGSPDVVKDGYNGLLVDPVVGDLTDKLEYIIQKDEKRRIMSKNMKKYYEEKLSDERLVKDIIESYKEHI